MKTITYLFNRIFKLLNLYIKSHLNNFKRKENISILLNQYPEYIFEEVNDSTITHVCNCYVCEHYKYLFYKIQLRKTKIKTINESVYTTFIIGINSNFEYHDQYYYSYLPHFMLTIFWCDDYKFTNNKRKFLNNKELLLKLYNIWTNETLQHEYTERQTNILFKQNLNKFINKNTNNSNYSLNTLQIKEG